MYYAEGNLDKYIREKYFFNFDFKGTMIEVGAGTTDYKSISKHFRDHDWRCICVEPNPKFVEAHKKLGHEIYQYACSNENKKGEFTIVNLPTWHSKENDGLSCSAIKPKYSIPPEAKIEKIEVEIITLNNLLEKIDLENFDFITVDTEGWEIEVIQGLDLQKYQPKIIVLENLLDNSNVEFMKSLGYEYDNKIEYNEIYFRK